MPGCGSLIGWICGFVLLFIVAANAMLVGFPRRYPSMGAERQERVHTVRPLVVMASLDVVYSDLVNASIEYIYVYSITNMSKDTALRLRVESGNASLNLPLLFAVRQQRGILSWPLPVALHSSDTKYLYNEVNKTICPVQNYIHSSHSAAPSENLFLEVSTASEQSVGFSLVLRRQYITVRLQKPRNMHVSPSSPQFIRFDFPKGVDTALIRVTSEDDLCATVSVQNISCPIYDSQQDVAYGNQYQTLTMKAAITVQREQYPSGMFIVFVVHGDDTQCSQTFQNFNPLRRKQLQVVVQEKISPVDYLTATLGALAFCGLFYLLSVVLSVIHYIRQRRHRQELPDESPSPVTNYGTISADSSGSISPTESSALRRGPAGTAAAVAGAPASGSSLQRADSDSSLDESELDTLPEVDHDKNLFRTKTLLYVSDLARKNPRVLAKKTQLYIWNLITIAVFYSVPVVQLVITYQKVLNVTGDQDICYYNFLCAHPLGVLSDFNHVYSNIGYVLLGLLFIGLTKRRDLLHQKLVQQNDRFEQFYGIPRHFGLFYAMGASLMMEGILSACYHVCPSYSNFQFDTAFMYVIAVLCMLKIYQTRHPDINANAYAAFLVLAFTVFVGVIGVLQGDYYFWAGFMALHMASCLVLSAQIYYMGRWSIDCGVFMRIYQGVRNDLRTSPTHCFRPAYPDRMALLVLGNLVNLVLAIFGALTLPKDFASYLLTIFITNLLLYTSFYIIMKLRHHERILLQPLIYILLSMLAWGAALYFFVKKSTTWQVSPAQSRTKNRDCEILNFYDDHDIWHFLSASSMFFGFMILLTLDDDLVFTRRDKIPVF